MNEPVLPTALPLRRPAAPPADLLADARDVFKSYDRGRIHVLRGVSLQLHAGEMAALWGASGSGKSTLLHLLGGLDLPDHGHLQVCGLDPRCETHRLRLRRQALGFVFQLHNLIPDLTMEENLQVPALAIGQSGRTARHRAAELAEQLGLGHRLRHRIQDLSGGERQRTAIARALMNRPRLLLADEPTGSLDEQTADSVFQRLKQLAVQEKIAVLLATHERRFAEQCDRLWRMRDGRLSAV